MKKINENERRRFMIWSNKLKWITLAFAFMVSFGLIGYGFILFGGTFVVDEESLLLDATTTIETTDGYIVGELYHENRTLADIDNVPDHVKEAFIAIEDRRFYDHAGVDFRSVIRAVYRDIVALDKVEGASTITQQLAKNLFLTNDKTWMRKTKEVMAAIYLERHFSKDQILELYMNQMYFGQGIYGIETAANFFFNKEVSDLTISEGALLAGLAKAPNGYSPVDHPDKALNRRNVVLQAMDNAEIISTKQRIQAQGKTLGLSIQEKKATPWVNSYMDLVIKEANEMQQLSLNELKRGGYRIVVNMDETAQKIAYEQFQQAEYFPGNAENVEGAFVMMDQTSGEIVAAIGGRNYELGDLNRTIVKRQPGSTIKPLAVYGPAMMNDSYDTYTLIPDQEIDYDGYIATNVDYQYADAVTIYEALSVSKNAPAVWLLNDIGIDYAKNYLTKMGIPLEDDGLAVALGGLTEGIAPLDMVRGYRSFAHNGEVTDPYTISRIEDQDGEVIYQANPSETEVFSEQVAWNMTEILTHTVQEGTAESGEYKKALAGKTGTTQHPYVDDANKDAWFVGYTPQYVTALWMGYDQSGEDHYLTGGSVYPTALTKRILTEFDKQTTLASHFEKPEHVEAVPEPIELPEIEQVEGTYTFGGFSLVNGKLSWSGSRDERVVYHIYQEQPGVDKRIGTVEGKTEYTIDAINVFESSYYYVVPYNPLTNMEGKKSKTVTLSMTN
ncbi:transglycosylase domain-containing protein [Oceanobacillus halotolerans]|uniref:transglycosylase domain-containing protein n=1 Tax=Oceanobacillus halotolerans TaxID=2663380 RepID=UPI0013DB3289|nr:PBP1A family penicillin-binding protein [Oceanobacillus halotolerans]